MTADHQRGASIPKRLTDESPKGAQLREILEGLVAELSPGSPLPSERELAEHYGVARMTVRGEIDRLTADGLTYRLQGRGTFVSEPRVAQAMALSSFSEDIRARGMQPSSRLIGHERIEAGEFLAAQLQLPLHAAVVRVERVRLADGAALALEQAYVPLDRHPGAADADYAKKSLFQLLEEEWDVRLEAADQRVLAMSIDGEAAELLEVAEGHPGLRFQTLARDHEGVPAFYAISLFRGDRYEIDLRQIRVAPGG